MSSRQLPRYFDVRIWDILSDQAISVLVLWLAEDFRAGTTTVQIVRTALGWLHHHSLPGRAQRLHQLF